MNNSNNHILRSDFENQLRYLRDSQLNPTDSDREYNHLSQKRVKISINQLMFQNVR